MKNLFFYLGLTTLSILPGMVIQLSGIGLPPQYSTIVYAIVFISIGFMLTWATDVTKKQLSSGSIDAESMGVSTYDRLMEELP